MERDRGRRYASALELAEDLRRVRTFEPIRAKAAGPLLRARKWARREPAKAVGLVALAVFALAGAGFLVSQRVERLRVARAHLERAQTLLAAGDFNAALEAVAQSRERVPDSTAALELKARIEAARDLAARDERKASDLRGSAAAREESAKKQQEYAALRAEVRPLQQRSREQRARVFGAYATGAARESLAALESELGQRRMQGERLLQEAQESLERAARLAAPWGETVETEQAFAAFYFERWREATDEGDAPRATLFRALVERHDTQHALASELLGLGQLRVSVDPPGAEIYLFRYESLERVRPGPCVPRLVPLPTRGTGVAREGPWTGDFYAGDACLRIAAVEPGSAAAAAGLRPGDLVLRLDGQPVGDGLFVAAHEVPQGIAPLARVATLNGSAIASRFDWSTVAPSEAGKSDQVGFFGRAGTLACDRSRLSLDSAENLIANGCPGVPFKILCLHAGAPLEFEVGGTNSGLRCERTAYPLICSPENRIEAGAGSAVDPGSYLLLARAPEREEQRFAVLVPRLGQIEVRLSLLPTGATPAGFVYIPPGSFIYGGDPEAIESVPLEQPELAGYCIGRREVTNAEWAEFVDDAQTQEAIQAAGKPKYFSREQSGAPIPPANCGGPTTPVMGIPWNDVRDYLAWRNRKAQREGDLLRYDLPSEEEWEKAARGVDGRAFPWGNRFDFDLVVGLHSKPTALFSAPGGFEPCDESPFGVQDAGGLRQEWTNARRELDASAPPVCFKRGGSWIFTRDAFFRSASRAYQDASTGGGAMGFRLVARPASGSAAPTGPANR
jgi:formylglycine-generating enzyme required for sulfatase activity